MLTPHSCRHTYVSQLQALGVDMETIQSMVGHADIEMTQHYLHVQEESRRAARPKNSVRPLESHADNVGNSLCFPLSNSGTAPEFKGAVYDR